jgi:hypothetical protein
VSDADVAVLHAPAELNFQPLSVALVDAQNTVTRIAERLGEPITEKLRQAASSLHFSGRTWKTICTEAGLGSLARELQQAHVYTKRDDALLLLEEVGRLPENRQLTIPTNWRLQRTAFYEILEKRILEN